MIDAGGGTGDIPIRDNQGNITGYQTKNRLHDEIKGLFNTPANRQAKFSGNVDVATGANGQQAVHVRENNGSGSGQITSSYSPFTVIASNNGTAGAYNLFVQKGLVFWNPEDSATVLTIPSLPAPLPWSGGVDKIWLEATTFNFNSPGSLALAVKSLGNGNSFGAGTIEDNGGTGTPTVYTQTIFRKILALVADNGHGAPVVTQLCNTNLGQELNALTSFTSNVIIPAWWLYPL